MMEDRTTEFNAESSDDYLFRASFESEPLASDSWPTEEERRFKTTTDLFPSTPSSPSKPDTGTKTSGRSAEERVEAAQETSEVDEDSTNDYLFPSSFESEPLASDSFPMQEERAVIECRIYDGPGEGNGDETDEEEEEGRED